MSMSLKARRAARAAGVVLVAGSAVAPQPAAAAQVRVGVLECIVDPGIGFIVASSKALKCTLTPSAGAPERYSGRISKLGLDIGVTGKSVMVWAVVAGQAGYTPWSLAGNYFGISAQASVALGVGANALIGGSDKSIVLQPLSVQAQMGLNLAAGVAGLTLTRR
jgi:hypothetical protein